MQALGVAHACSRSFHAHRRRRPDQQPRRADLVSAAAGLARPLNMGVAVPCCAGMKVRGALMSSLDIFTHVRVLVGVVLGLGLTRMLAGVASWVQHPAHKKLYATHLIWVAVVLLAAVHFWWFA